MKQTRLLGVLLTITLFIAACGGDNTTDTPVATEPPVELNENTREEPALEPVEEILADDTSVTADPEPAPEIVVEPTVVPDTPTQADLLFDMGGAPVRIAVENAFLPFNYVLFDTNEAGGWDYDAWDAICGILNCVPQFEEEVWDTMITSVRDGAYDVAADGLEVTESNSQFVEFSNPYINIDQRLMTRLDESRFDSTDGFIGGDFVLGVPLTSESGDQMLELLGESRVQTFDIFESGVSALLAGSIDAMLGEETAGQGYIGSNADQIKLVGQPLATRHLAFAFPPGSELIGGVNYALAQMEADGTLATLANKYFSSEFTLTYEDIGAGAYGAPAEASELPDLGGQEIKIAVENGNLPFNYVLASTGQAGGWDYDAWAEICSLINCIPVFEEAEFGGLVQAIADGQYDVAANGVTINQARSQIVDFSMGYLTIDQRMLVRLFEDRFNSVEDLVGTEFMVGTEAYSASNDSALEFLPFEQVVEFDSAIVAVLALEAGEVDAVIADEIVGQGYVGPNQVDFIGDSLYSEQFGFAFPQGSSLVAPVNVALNEMNENGTLRFLVQKYFSSEFTITENDIQ